MSPLRGLLLGTGNIARTAHLPGLLQGQGVAERLRIIGTVDPTRPGLLPGLPHFRDPEASSAVGPIDFVDICTPPATHLDLALWGLRSGYHVLCEKPVALSMPEVDRLGAARRSGQVIMACHQYRHNPAWQQIVAWLEEGRIGEWHLAEFEVHRTQADGGQAAVGEGPWRVRRALAGGGILLDHGTHLVYQILDVAGPPRAVQCWTSRLCHQEYEVEDTVHLVLDCGSRMATLLLTWGADRRETRIRFIGSRGRIEWIDGVLTLESRTESLTRDFSAELDKAGYFRWFAGLFHQFADRIDRRDGADAFEDIVRVTRVLEAAYRSDAEGRRLYL